MPNTNIIEKYYNELMKSNANMVLSTEYAEYLASIKKLADTFDKFSAGKDKKYPKLEKKDVEDIRKGYEDIFTKGRDFLDKAKNTKAGKDKTFKTRIALVMNAEEKITESSMAFAGAVSAEGMTLPEILDTIRGRDIQVEANQLKTVGDALSARVPMEFTTESGKKVEGYFTEYTTRDFKRDRDELIEKVDGGNKNLNNIFRTLFADDELMRKMNGGDVVKESFIFKQLKDSKYNGNMAMAHILGRAFPDYDNNFPLSLPNSAYNTIYNITENDKNNDLTKRIITFLREAHTIYNRHNVAVSGVKMVGTKKIEDRNAAMTAVADLLGCSDIIARSTKMSIVVNGQRKEGIFMENAEGCDLSKIDDKSPLSKLKDKNSVKPEFYSQLADLQILDFICGNTDRHGRNLMYKTETEMVNGKEVTKVSGLMGIDNDSSFGVLDGTKKSMRLPSVENIGVINEKTANRVKMMTPELLALALKPYHLDKKEVLAAQKRLKLVKQAIISKKINIYDEKKWENLNVDALFTRRNGRKKNTLDNYFNTFSNLKEKFDDERRYQFDANEKLYKLKRAASQLADYELPQKTKVTAAKGREMREADMVEINSDKFLQLQHEINTATAFNGTKQYKDIADLLTEVGKYANKTNSQSDLADWQLLKMKYNRLEKMVDAYLTRKENERISLYAKGKTPSSTAQNRVMAMSSLKRFLQSRDIAVTKYVEGQRKEPVNLDNIKKEIAKIKKQAENGNITDEMLAKLAVKEHIISEAGKGKTFTREDEYNGMVRLSKNQVFKNAIKKIFEPKKQNARLTLEGACDLLNSQLSANNTTIDGLINKGKQGISLNM